MSKTLDMIRYDSVCLTCSKKLTGSQLSLPHGTNKKIKCKTKNKMMIMIGPEGHIVLVNDQSTGSGSSSRSTWTFRPM